MHTYMQMLFCVCVLFLICSIIIILFFLPVDTSLDLIKKHSDLDIINPLKPAENCI